MSLMRAAGYEPEAFSCAGDFLNSEQARRSDCLIADVQMPGMSGLELHGQLMQSGHAIPTVLITAHPNDKARARALHAGVICYLTKPFNENELLDCIQIALDMGTRSEKS